MRKLLNLTAIALAIGGCGDSDGQTGDACSALTCADHAHCQRDAAGAAACVCDLGYADLDGVCALPSDPCAPNPCTGDHRTACVDVGGQADCRCDAGYVDDGAGGCEELPDPCEPNPCAEPNRTACLPLNDGVTCLCDPGYVEDEDGDCVWAFGDPCDPDPCVEPHRGVCVDDAGFPRCDCDDGFAENPLGECVPTADPCDPSPCTLVPNRTVCTPAAGGTAACSCADGFVDDGLGGCDPVLVDPCDPNPCTTVAHMGHCEADGDQAVCGCDDGWHDDGQGGCSDDACVPNPCGTTGQTACQTSGAGVVCGCDGGWVPDGQGGCVEETPGPCEPNPCDEALKTVCVESGASYTCACDAAAHPDGAGGCTLDPCLPNPCDAAHRGVCAADPGEAAGYRCDCDPDYHLDGGACVDACTPNPCAEPGRTACATNGAEAVCGCDAGLHEDGQGGCTADPCLPDPCSADQVCVASGGQTSCVPCADGDHDTYGVGVGCAGPDCDDSDENVHDGCACPPAHPQGDSFEEDECFFIAAEIAPGATQDHTVEPAGDVDWVRFTVAAGDMIELQRSSTPSASLRLYDRDGTTLIVDATRTISRKMTAPGEYFARVAGSSASTTGAYTLTLVNHGQDDHGDGPGDATVLLADDQTTAASFQIYGNVDWFAFDAEARHQYQIRGTGLAGQGIKLQLYDTDGETLLETVTQSYSGTALMDREDLPPGRYFLRASANYGTANAGAYELRITDLGLDDHGDNAAEATALTPDGTPLDASFEVGGNVDWFSFPVLAGHLYQMVGEAHGTGVRMRLYDTDGATLIEEGSATYSGTVRLDREGLPAGTYYLSLSPAGGNVSTGPYTVRVVDLGVNDHGLSSADATAIAADGGWVDGVFEVGGNTDWFSFPAVAAHLYQIRAVGEGMGVQLRLYGTDGETLVEERTATYSSTAFIDREGLGDGTFFLRLRPGGGNTSTGAYQLQVVDLGLDDHGSTAATATAVSADGSTLSARFEVGGNTDWFSFPIAAAHQYRVAAQGAGMGVELRLYGPDGETLIEERTATYSSTASIDVEDLAPGTYYVRTKPGGGNTSYGDYTLRVEDLGLDDHGDTPEDATLVATDDQPVGGVFEVGANVDWMAFDLAAGHMVAVRAAPQGTGVVLRLYDTDGTTLIEERSSSYSNTALLDRDDLPAGRYFLRLKPGSGNSAIGAYTVRVADLGPNDHGTGPGTATALATDGTPTAGAFEVGGNRDWFAFAATSGASYALRCTPTGTGCQVTLYEPDGSTIVTSFSSSYSSTALKTWTAPSGGTWFLRVATGSGNSTTGSYQVQVTAQ
ncbi:MAG: hypothetical protein EP329_26525 [Deltaproteobacteria bacterium]|nr:MAG: hypothetical protein EP329_26525 [Deltaproteobacteria bacterium]